MGKKSRGKAGAKGTALKSSVPKGWILGGASAALVLAVVLLSLFAPSALGLGSKPEGPAVAKAPEVVLATYQGDYRLSDQRGKVLLLYFSYPG